MAMAAAPSLEAEPALSSHAEDQGTRSPTARDAAPDRHLDLLDTLANLSTLGIFGFLGLLARLGLVALGSYNGQTSFALLWAQVVGCALMGAFTVRKAEIEAIYTPLYAGLATGLCGSITSFSSWIADVFLAFAHIGYPASASHGGFYNFMDGLGQSIFTLAASVAAFTFGTHVGPVFLQSSFMTKLACWVRLRRSSNASRRTRSEHNNGSKEGFELQNGHRHGHGVSERGVHSPNGQQTPVERSPLALPGIQQRYPIAVQLGVCLVFLSLWLASIIICVYVSKWRGIVLFGLVMAPPGVWLRFYLSRLNLAPPHTDRDKVTRGRAFPIGTFIANQFGTAVLAACLAVQFTRGPTSTTSSGSVLLTCQALQGLSDGFCGCLTTVSTFIVEIRKLKRGEAYVYVLVSWSVGQVLLLVILGSVDFSKGGGMQKCVLR